MADVQSNIKVSIDTTEALASIKNLQRQISAFHTSMAKGGAAANAVTSQMQQNLINSVNATGKFSAQMRTIKTTTESFTSSLEKNKFSMGEYFRYAGGASKSFGRLFKTEFETINKVARENVKDLQTQYIKMGRDANGAMKAIAVRPLSLDMNNLATKTMVAAQKQAILNQLLKQGSTNLLNFGKNTQWAGRQLMVGFTIPLMALGAAASKTFMDMETQAIRFKKVYGDLFTSTTESTAALDAIKNLGKEFTKYGIAVADTVGLASEAAAAGFKGVDLQRQTAAATRLSILGQVESQKALETTIALQNAFSMSSEDLAKNIDFLNAVENQTVLSLDDMSTAIPKAAPVIQQLGGDVKDLAFFMAAMKEGGINASEGANALKSGLAAMINPTGKASAMLEGFGINIKKIVVDNKGDLKKTVTDFATALNKLDPLNRAQAIEQMFGKFQFARLSTLFANVTKEGTQAARVLDLAGASIQELAALSEKELGQTSESAMNKFKSSIEQLKLSLVPLGEQFLKVITPIAEFITKVLDKFNSLGDGTKKIIVVLTAVVAGLGPVLLMTFGLLMNGLANIIKGFTFLKSIFNKAGRATGVLGTEVKYMTTEQRNAAAVASSLDQVHRNLAQTFSSEAAAVDALTRAYYRAVAAQSQFMPIRVPLQRGSVTKRAKGKPARVGGTGNQDTELALLMPGETVIPTKMSKKYGGLINGMIADNIPGYMSGKSLAFAHASMPFSPGSTQYAEGIRIAGLEGLVKVFPQWIKVVSNLVAEIPQALNVKMKTGTGIGEFEKDYASRTGKFLSSGILGGIDPTNKNEIAGLQKLEDAIGKRAVALAKGTKEQLVTDDLFAKATREVIDENIKLKGSTGRAAKALDTVSKQVGQVRVSATQQGLREGLKSGLFRRTRKSTQTQNQIMFDNVNVGRESSSSPNTFYSANPITPRGSYRSAKKRSISVIQPMALSDAAAYNETIEKNTEDIYVKSRKRKSPHSLAPKDGKDDARAYNRAVDKELTRGGKKRRVAFRPQGPAPIIPANVSTQIIPPIIPSGYVPPEGPMYGPRTPTKYDKTVGRVAGKFRSSKIARLPGTGMGMSLSSAAMMGSYMIPGKTGDIVQKVSMAAFALSSLTPVIKGLITVLGGFTVGIISTVLALGVGAFLINKSSKQAAKEIVESAKREAEARVGSTRAIEQFGKTFNKSLPSEREFSRNNKQGIKASGTRVDEFAKDYATKGNISTQIINQAAAKGKVSGINAVAMDVAQKAAIFGLSPEDISAMIKAASNLIGADQIKVNLAVQKLLSPDGKDILKEPLSIDARINFLNNATKDAISKISTQIAKISLPKVEVLDSVLKNPITFNYQDIERAAGYQAKRNSQAQKGGLLNNLQTYGIDIGTGTFGTRYQDQLDAYNQLQLKIQATTVGLNVLFMQQTESLALLNAQYSDGTITEEVYNEQLALSRTNFDSLESSSLKLVKQLTKIDHTGGLAGAAVGDLGNQALAALKKSNPELFAKITESFKKLDDAAKVNIYIGYMQGSLTVLDLALLPEILQKITGKPFEVAIKIIADSELTSGAKGTITSPIAQAELELANAQAAAVKARKYLDVSEQVAADKKVARAKQVLAEAKKFEEDAQRAYRTGLLNSDLDGYQDLENGTDGAKTATERYLEVLDKEIDALKAKRDAQKDANDEIQREIDLKNKLEDLQKQSIDAKISGDYIKSAMLAQEANQLKMKYDQETELKKKDDEIARLEARYNAIKDGANLTALEKSRIPVLKKANGGAVKGFNTGGNVRGAGTATSDSIPAYLSNGEYVIKADSVKKYGIDTFDALNAGKYADGGIIQGFRTGGLNRIAKSGISSIGKMISSKLSLPNVPNITSGVNSVFEEWAKVTIHRSLTPDQIQFANMLKKSDLKKIFPTLTGSLNTVNKAEVLKTGEKGYLKSGMQLDPLEVRREIFGSLFARRADLLAPSNTAVELSNSRINPLGVFSRSLEEMSPGSLSEKFLFQKLKVAQRDIGLDDKTFALTSKNYASLGMTSEKSYRDAILDSMGFSDSHGGNLYLNPMEKKAGAIDFGRIGESIHAIDIFGGKDALNSLQNKYYRRYVNLPESERSAYLEGLRKASETLSGIKDTELIDMLRMSGYKNDEIKSTSDIYKSYMSNVMEAINDRLSSKKIEGWDENIPKIDVNEDWYKKLGASLNPGKFANGGAVQGFRTGGLNRVASGFAKKIAFAIPNKINEIKNYLKVRSMIKDGMWHGSQPTGGRGEEYLQGKNVLEGAETYDPHYGMGFFGTSSKSEADMYAAGYNSSSNWGEAFGSINKITKAPFGKYVDFTRGTNSIKWQNYKLYQALGMEKDGYLNSYLPENLGDIMAGQNVTGSIMKRISDGQVPGDMGSAKWLAWSKPAGVHTEEYTGGRYAPKKPASLLDNLKSKFSLLKKPKGYNVGGHIRGAGTTTSDSIPAMLSDGEYVIRASSVKKYGTETFDALNAQRFSEGSPGGVKPGAISKAGLMKANAKAGAMWQAMEEIEKGLSLKYGANPNSSGLEKWSKALGRVAFNTLQGGVSGAVAAPSPWAVLTGAVAGLAEGLYGIGTEGSQYGVKGGKYATPKGAKTRRFNPKEQLDNMNLMGSAGNIAMSGAFSSVLGMLPFKRMAEGIGKIVPKSVKNFGTNAKESIQSKLSSANNIKIGNPLKSDKLKNLIVAAMIGFQKPFLGNSSSSVLPNFSLNKTSIVDEINKKIGNYSVNKVRFGDSLHKQYNIQHAKKPIVFQGHTEDLSNVTGDADIVSTSNIGILSKALEMKPGDKHLQKMLDNFKAGPLALGQDEKLFLDRKAASIGVSDTLEVLPTENTDGLALFLSSLIGDQESANLVTAKQNVLYASIVKNKQKIIESRIKNPHISNTEPVDLSTVPLIHSTPYPVIREADNSVKIYPAGHHNLNDVDLATGLSHSYPRVTVHLGAESSVADHVARNASKTQTRVIGKASDMVDRNGLPENFIPTDVYYVRDVGQSLDFSNPAIIKDFVDKTLYTETLIREGLLLPGQKPKVLTVDPNKNNLYLLKKPTYNQTDRKTIQKFIDDNSDLMTETSGSAGIRVPFSNTAGNEEVILDKIAIQLAKKKLGINTSYIGQSGPETLNYLPRNNEYAAFAQKHNLGFEFHAGTDLSMAEKQMIGGFGSGSHITLGGTGVDTYSKAQQAYIESVRMQMMHNSTKTNIKRLDKMDEEELLEKGYTHKKVGYQIPPIVEWRSAFPKGDPNYGEIVTKEQQTLNYLADIEKAAKKKRPGAASGGLITQRGLINQKAISTRYNLPSFATGIDYLPNDMIAQLHQGERVLTKEENKTYSSSAPTTNIININGSDLNKKEIAQAVMVELDRAKNKNNKTNMVGR